MATKDVRSPVVDEYERLRLLGGPSGGETDERGHVDGRWRVHRPP